MAELLVIQVLSRHFGRYFGNYIFIFWHIILRILHKFEPNWFINGSVIGNLSFEPPSWSIFWKVLIFIC